MLTDAGYTYVPAAELDERYDGSHPGLREMGVNWYSRFFSYL